MGKLFTTILNDRLLEWVEDNQLITDYQFGFRKNRRTLDALFITHTISVLSHVRRKPMFVAFIDFAKAFDSVQHEYL